MIPPSAVFSRSEAIRPAPPRLQRTEGEGAISFSLAGNGGTRLVRLRQCGATKIRLPNVPADAPPVAVLINTAGGLTGGDRLGMRIAVGERARAVATSQACEKIYRSAGGSAVVATRLEIGKAGRLDWLPQETILFDGGRIERRLEADLAEGATLLAVEATIFGRTAHGESVRSGLFRDRWRIRRNCVLAFADDLRFEWADAGLLDRPAVLAGGCAIATILFIGPGAEERLPALRAVVGEAGGVSAWNGKLLARIVCEGGAALRRVTSPALIELLDGAALPKLWQI